MDPNDLLARAVERGATDVHLKLGRPPVLRRDGELLLIDNWPELTDADLESVLATITALDRQRRSSPASCVA